MAVYFIYWNSQFTNGPVKVKPFNFLQFWNYKTIATTAYY